MLVSACLLGFACRHDGRSKRNDDVLRVLRGREVVPVCPEAAGGLGIPRPAHAFEDGRLRTRQGADGTPAFERGARIAREGARRWGAREAILKARSPSCGVRRIYVRQDGEETPREGSGVTARALAEDGLSLRTEEDL